MEEPNQREPSPNGGPSAGPPRVSRSRNPNLVFLLIAISLLAFVWLATDMRSASDVPYTFFLEQIQSEPKNLLRLEIGEDRVTGIFDEPPAQPDEVDREGKKVEPRDSSGKRKRYGKNFEVVIPRNDSSRQELFAALDTAKIAYRLGDSGGNALVLFEIGAILLTIGMFAFFWFQFRRTRDQLMGGGFLSGFSKSPAKRYEGARQPTTFKDVAGLEGVKGDLMEIVDFLKNPQKFQRLGGRIPKGVLLNGPPGTGKTLLARAVAGEAGVPFFSVSGSEFIQMFVGVGASRVRDLFKTAKDNAPAIIFIDEIDAVGRQRGAGLGGGHDEREQTLNQILSEMDGFSQTEAVIVLAATNRPDVLDPALLRPGRFDRHVTVGRPTQKGRVEIFKVHIRDVPLDEDVDIDRLASSTIGLTGADIRNIVNEAALWAARNNKSLVDRSDFEHARDKILMGAKREEVLQEKEKEKTAYHEAGHTLTAWKLPGAYRVHKVTIIPRGRSLGSTHTLPSEDRLSMSESEIRDHLMVMLGGRAAEKIVYHESTIGAENDLERATDLARHMVTHWGMSERLGPVSYKTSEDDPFLGREIHRQRQVSERTMQLIDEEVASILLAAQNQALRLLTENRDQLEKLTLELIKSEELDEVEITAVIGPSVHHLAAPPSTQPPTTPPTVPTLPAVDPTTDGGPV